MVESDKSTEVSSTPLPTSLEQPTTNELESKASLEQSTTNELESKTSLEQSTTNELESKTSVEQQTTNELESKTSVEQPTTNELESKTSVEQPTTNELESKTSVEQPLASEETAKDANDYKLEIVTANNMVQNDVPVQNLQTQIIKTISEQVYNEQPLSLPLQQPNLTQLQPEVAQSLEQPSIAEESVDTGTLPAEDDDGGQLETKRASKRILNDSPEQQLELKVTSSNGDLSNADVTILPVEKTDDNQEEPPSKKIRSEEPVQELHVSLLEHLKNPTSWYEQCDDETKQIEIRRGSCEYNTLQAKLATELRKQLRICRLQNPYLYHRYMLTKAEYIARGIRVEERTLLHATDSSKVQSILKGNFNWRLVGRAKYGRGTSFSHSSLYANKECNKRNGSRRAMLIVKVLVGKECGGSQSLPIPPADYDTTTGNTNVVVKYYDDEFYPEYVVYYSL